MSISDLEIQQLLKQYNVDQPAEQSARKKPTRSAHAEIQNQLAEVSQIKKDLQEIKKPVKPLRSTANKSEIKQPVEQPQLPQQPELVITSVSSPVKPQVAKRPTRKAPVGEQSSALPAPVLAAPLSTVNGSVTPAQPSALMDPKDAAVILASSPSPMISSKRLGESQTKLQRIQRENEELERQISALSVELCDQRQLCEKGRNQVVQSLNTQNEVKAQLARLQIELVEAQKAAEAAIQEKTELMNYYNSQAGESRKERTYLQQIEEAKNENKHLKVVIYKAQKENMKLRDALKEVQLEVQAAKKRQQEISNSKCLVAKSEVQASQMKKEVQEKSQEVLDLKEQVKKLRAEKAAAKKEYEDKLFLLESRAAEKELGGK